MHYIDYAINKLHDKMQLLSVLEENEFVHWIRSDDLNAMQKWFRLPFYTLFEAR